ncbi:SGNH/GDSL hydrolase family protein [Streptomyces iconiensis]|uniref:SGNH/GDSL hydrolase family protein n=1 Tax=Streptomyces iconiensis TaxID=1384038 RepID=A0ABT6ZZM8_9ACTN|nr:SGNH/GDSL hydrolase family protein [Streptomyces iconiensis]MDJ1134530.1 SGNH/GDSL hydrolase family protein [Streptomyces iconiensis]
MTGSSIPTVTGPVESYVAIGDSFTEGVGDPGPDGTFVGWADRLAGMLAAQAPPGFRYANLAVRGRLLGPIVAEQVPRATALAPDLVTFCAGGNDILRPGSDPDALAEQYEKALVQLLTRVGTVVVCTGFDTRGVPVLRHLRGKIATYNTHLWALADRHHCPVLDLWSLRSVQERDAWSEDRLHLSALGHERVARRCAEALGVEAAAPSSPVPPPAALTAAPSLPAAGPRSPAAARRDDLHWARHHLLPWIGRRLRGQSSGDHVEAKRPELLPL